MFAGEGAKTADKQALKVAKDMKAAGVPDETIHAKTKWFFGSADGKPRFEIDDSAAKVNENIDVTRGYGIRSSVNEKISTASDRMLEAQSLFNEGVPANKVYKMTGYVDKGNGLEDFYTPPLPKLFEHDALAAAYPSTDNLSLRVLSKEGARGSGAYDSVRDSINLFTANADSTKDILATKDVALHELQHAIQQREGFARGGSPETFAREKFSIKRDIEDQITALNEAMRRAQGTPKYGELIDLRSELVRDMNKQGLRDSIDIQESAHQHYRRLAGEAEARLTQSRMNMNPAERAASYPPSMFDVPVKDQIVRYGDGQAMSAPVGDNVGGAMIQRPKTEFEILHDTAQRNAALPVEQGGLGLPANNTYIDRANAPGMFPTDAYTGTNQDIRSLDPSKAQFAREGSGSWASENPEFANSYAGRPDGNVMPLRINTSKFGELDALNSNWNKIPSREPIRHADGTDSSMSEYIQSVFDDFGNTNLASNIARKMGDKGLIVNNVKDYGGYVGGAGDVPEFATNFAIHDPSQVRSRFAAFDPMRRHEADILAGVGVGGMLDPQAIAEALRQQDRK
jgi:hypothetical protein